MIHSLDGTADGHASDDSWFDPCNDTIEHRLHLVYRSDTSPTWLFDHHDNKVLRDILDPLMRFLDGALYGHAAIGSDVDILVVVPHRYDTADMGRRIGNAIGRFLNITRFNDNDHQLFRFVEPDIHVLDAHGFRATMNRLLRMRIDYMASCTYPGKGVLSPSR